MLGLSKNGAGIKPGEHLLGLLEMMLCLGSMLAEKAAAQTEQRLPRSNGWPYSVHRAAGWR
jgi:hypothetical protein